MSESKARVVRQDENTTLDELEGEACEGFVGVLDRNSDRYEVFYIVLDGVSHRFFLDAGLLFWRSHEVLNPENDLSNGSEYVDLGDRHELEGYKVGSISMKDCMLTLEFIGGKRMAFANEVEGIGARLVDMHS